MIYFFPNWTISVVHYPISIHTMWLPSTTAIHIYHYLAINLLIWLFHHLIYTFSILHISLLLSEKTMSLMAIECWDLSFPKYKLLQKIFPLCCCVNCENRKKENTSIYFSLLFTWKWKLTAMPLTLLVLHIVQKSW